MMDQSKLASEVETLQGFIKIYCDGENHQNRQLKSFTCKSKEFTIEFEETLCKECQTLLQYSLQRLQECPYETKPRCRKCTTPCYEKNEWKALAKVMRSSGLKLGVIRVKKIVNSFLFLKK